MANENLSDFEFYPDRFLKYKYKEKKYLNCTIVKETWDNNPAQQSMYNIADEFYHRSINVPNHYIHVDYYDIRQVFENPDNFKDSNFVLLPTEVSLFEGATYWIPGPVFETTETIILSSVPKQTTLTSLIFLNIETQVMVLLLLALLSVSLTLTLVQSVRKSSKTRTKSSRSSRVVALNCLKHCWNSSSIFYSEPYPFIPRIVSARIATLGWLLGVTLFVSMVNCVIKSDFSEERYQYLDDLETLMENEEIKPIVIEDGFTHLFLKKASNRDRNIEQYLSKFDENNFCSVAELMDLAFYEDILNGKKALIINRLLLTWFLGYLLSEDLPETRSLRDKYGGLYISKRRVKSDFLAFLVNRTFSIVSPILREQEGLGNLVFFETAVFRYLDLKSMFALHFMEWMKPTKVMVFLFMALLSVSLAFILIQVVRNTRKIQLDSSNSSKVVALNCLQHLWNSSSIFCSEPLVAYPFIPRIVSARMVTVGWLLGVVLVVSMVNCFMKSDFSEERYQYLDGLETLMENKDVKPVII